MLKDNFSDLDKYKKDKERQPLESSHQELQFDT